LLEGGGEGGGEKIESVSSLPYLCNEAQFRSGL